MTERNPPPFDPIVVYRERTDAFSAALMEQGRRSRLLSHARLAVFLFALLALAAAIGADPGLARTLLLVVAIVAAALFVALATAHARVRRAEDRFFALHVVNQEGPHRVARNWNALPQRESLHAPDDHPYARDLDVGGHASIMQLLGAIGSAAGVQRVREWLLDGAPPPAVLARQRAVAEMAELRDLRDALAAQRLLHRRTTAAELERFLDWCESPPERLAGWLLVARWLLPPLAVGGLLLTFAGAAVGLLWVVPLSLNILIIAMYGARLRQPIESAASREGPLRHAAAAFELLAEARLSAPLLVELRQRLGGDERHALREARALERITHTAEVRYSPMVHFTLQTLLLWDVHVVVRLDAWRRRAGGRARDWLGALGEIEALAALGTLAHDNPEWTYPTLTSPAAPVLEAQALGHPLIAPEVRVSNDVTVGPAGTFLLVTGSNMSGKSTLLRAIGLNTVLALAGAPVCAREMRLPPLRVFTSMRVQDSLEQGISFFMAELLRLRSVVEAARVGEQEHVAPLLYLLDEILQGTNTAERQVAARRIIRELLSLPAIGAVTSHDLSLADSDVLRAASVPVHFTEHVVRDDGVPRMTFDYRLRPGLATSVNALTLMEMIGLAPNEGDRQDVMRQRQR